MRRLIRQSLRTGGDPVDAPVRARKHVPRKLVVLCDVSGSMDSYARALLLFLHAAVGSGPGVEVFAFGTRLTRLTAELGSRDPSAALEQCTEAVHDWGSGTRIGASLQQFNDVYGRRALSRGAVVLIVSDGWERDGHRARAREMARLSRAAYAVVWVNPLKGDPRYQPLAGGMRAALPYIDRFISGHNVRSLETLAAVLAGIARRHAPATVWPVQRCADNPGNVAGADWEPASATRFDQEELPSARDRRQVVRDLRARRGGLGGRAARHGLHLHRGADLAPDRAPPALLGHAGRRAPQVHARQRRRGGAAPGAQVQRHDATTPT